MASSFVMIRPILYLTDQERGAVAPLRRGNQDWEGPYLMNAECASHVPAIISRA